MLPQVHHVASWCICAELVTTQRLRKVPPVNSRQSAPAAPDGMARALSNFGALSPRQKSKALEKTTKRLNCFLSHKTPYLPYLTLNVDSFLHRTYRKRLFHADRSGRQWEEI